MVKKIRTITKIGSLKRKPPVKARAASTNVLDHSYSPETGHLTVTFHGGRQYRYEGVDQKTADGLGSADSKGSFLHTHILGQFRATKI
jgi:hypothetical protein